MHALPGMDGNILDLVVDYLTCVMLPVAFMAYFHTFPHGWTVVLCALILFTAVLWFARTDLMTEDHWFRGFPAIWNLVAPTFFLLRSPHWVNIVVTIILCVLTLSHVKFVHPMQVVHRRIANVTVTALWLAAMLALTLTWPTTYLPLEAVLILAPAWYVFVTIERTIQGDPVPAPRRPDRPRARRARARRTARGAPLRTAARSAQVRALQAGRASARRARTRPKAG